MNSLIVAIGLLSFICNIQGHVSPVSDSFYACLSESKLTREEFIKSLSSNDIDDITRAQCIASCTMEKERFMKGETIFEDKIITKMAEVSREIGKEQITYLVKVCADEAKEENGKCGVAHSVVRCIHDSLKSEGWI